PICQLQTGDPPMKILIAEDDEITNQILVETLSKWQYEVISTTNGTEAWQMLQQEDAPKLALLDWMMPGINGIELCEKIRARRQSSYTYILLLTGKTEKADIIRGLDAGADDYIAKPCDHQELKVRL